MEVNKGPASPAIDSDASPAVHKDTTAVVAVNKEADPPATTLPPAVGKDTVKTNVLLSSSRDDDEFDDDESSDDEGTPMIDKYGTNLTKLAQEGKLNHLDGKEELVERVIQILCRKSKHSPCLIGYAGMWKTAIIEGLAKRIQTGMVPQRLKDKKVIGFTANKPRSFGTYPGNLMPFSWYPIIKEIERSRDMIVFFDESCTLSNIGLFESALVKGDIQCIGATHHLGEYTNNSRLRGLLTAVEVPEPSTDEAIKILKGICESYETHHKVSYTEEALVAAVMLSNEYLKSKYNEPLVDIAIDLIDEAGSRVQLLQGQAIDLRNIKDQSSKLDQLKPTMKTDTYHNNDDKPTVVKKKDILHALSSRIGIPVHEFPQELGERLLRLEETLHDIITGQDEAFAAIADAIRRAKVGLKSIKKPIASFLFTGPVGIGNTEVSKVLAKQCFGSEDFVVQFDMNVYKEKHQVSRLIGPPGFIGGQLIEAIKFKPQTVLLFSNVETAHSDILDFMLQILDDAMVKDNKGRIVDFTKTIIIFTSNVGSEVINKRSSHKVDKGKINNLVMEKVKKCFRAEFLNRIDEVIIFKQPSKKDVAQIADLMFKEVGNKLKDKGIKVIVSDELKERVVKDGYSPCHGTRHLRKVITEKLENPLARKLLSKEIKEGDSVFVDVDFGAKKKVFDEPCFEGKNKKWCCLFG